MDFGSIQVLWQGRIPAFGELLEIRCCLGVEVTLLGSVPQLWAQGSPRRPPSCSMATCSHPQAALGGVAVCYRRPEDQLSPPDLAITPPCAFRLVRAEGPPRLLAPCVFSLPCLSPPSCARSLCQTALAEPVGLPCLTLPGPPPPRHILPVFSLPGPPPPDTSSPSPPGAPCCSTGSDQRRQTPQVRRSTELGKGSGERKTGPSAWGPGRGCAEGRGPSHCTPG